MAEHRRARETDVNIPVTDEDDDEESQWVSAKDLTDAALTEDQDDDLEEPDFPFPGRRQRQKTEASGFSFDPRWQSEFEGLVYLGYLQDTFPIMGHDFTLRTLKHGEKLKITQICNAYEQSTLGFTMAYHAAVVAASVVLVDGKPLYSPEKKVDPIVQKFRYLIDNWHTVVINEAYTKVDELEARVVNILRDMGMYDQPEAAAEVESSEESEDGGDAP